NSGLPRTCEPDAGPSGSAPGGRIGRVATANDRRRARQGRRPDRVMAHILGALVVVPALF
ncbi:MAG: hypothetical protein ACYCZY_05375, partial [Lacisediminihabitans sp.]